MESGITDKERVRQCLAGEAGAWDRLVLDKTPLLRGAIRKALAGFGAADAVTASEDALQDTFAALLKDDGALLRRFQWGCSLDHYLVSIAVRRSVDWLRRNRRAPGLDGENGALWNALRADAGSGPAAALEAADHNDRLYAAIRRLPPKDQLAVRLFYLQGAPAAAVARALKLRPDSLWARLTRARRVLRELLKGTTFSL